MTNTQTDSDCPVTNAHGQAGGLYYPSQGAYGLQEALGLTDEQRNAIADELRAAYYLARTEGEEEADDRIRSEEREVREAAAGVIDNWQDWLNAPRGEASAQAQLDLTNALVKLDSKIGRLAENQAAAAISKTERTEG